MAYPYTPGAYPTAPFYNPLAPYQQRLDTLQQQYPQYAQPGPPAPVSGPAVNARLVTGEAEAMASQIPLDNSINLFADLSHGKIYVKQLNMQDGSAIFKTYQLTGQNSQEPDPPQPGPAAQVEYAKKEEVDRLKAEWEELKELLTRPATPAAPAEKPRATRGAVEKQ